MHIGFLLTEYPHPKVNTTCGGIGTATHNVVLGLLRKGYAVSVFVYGQDKAETVFEDNFTLYKIAKNTYKYFGWYFYRKQLNKYINSVIADTKITVLEAPDWGGITAFMKFKIPLILRLHGSDTYFCHLENRRQKKKNYFFEKQAYKKADAVISVSRYTLKITEKLFGKKPLKTVIPNGLFLESYIQKNNDKTVKNTVLYFGTLVRKKGVLELAQIFNELVLINRDAKLLVLGRDVTDAFENRSTLLMLKNRLSAKAKENFEYKGVLPYDKVKETINKAAVCVFPSLAESFGMVTIEAMALKKAVVNTNYPWAKEIITDGETGYLEDPKNHKSFAEKINKLLTDENLCVALGEKGFTHVFKHFSIEKIIDKNLSFYNKIVSQ
ncbi:MAG: glycosyltransferase family 4 protein [Flavobacteriaceae bacterium]|nr:glycosyltransferase family 4 protein [Flavobacteriaceae bacterium]